MTICSLIVQATPAETTRVSKELELFKGVEVHASDKRGKIIVTIDHPDSRYCSTTMENIALINGVMSTALVYEYQEDRDIEPA